MSGSCCNPFSQGECYRVDVGGATQQVVAAAVIVSKITLLLYASLAEFFTFNFTWLAAAPIEVVGEHEDVQLECTETVGRLSRSFRTSDQILKYLFSGAAERHVGDALIRTDSPSDQ